MRKSTAWAIVLAIVVLLWGATFVAAQSFNINCVDGVARATPTAGGLLVHCVAFTPTPPQATQTPTRAPTATRTPVATAPIPTPTPRPTQTPTGSVLAFPGAEGFGANSLGGRGGRIIEVTNLEDSGTGSLRDCINATGPRTCVFRVGGVIALNSTLTVWNPYLTIAGQTAPGGGITLKAAKVDSTTHLHIRTHNVIVRYLTSRPGTRAESARALSISNSSSPPNNVHDVMIDHVSLSWAGDEILILWARTDKVTIQWSILAESLPNDIAGSVGLKGPNVGDTNGGGNYSLHHNLLAHHHQRFPKINTAGGPADLVNNVMYNMGSLGAIVQSPARVNFTGNYAKAGPNTRITTFVKLDGGQFYTLGNIGDGLSFGNGNASARYPAAPVTSTTAQEAYAQVLAQAGNNMGLACDGTWIERRDPVDKRIVLSVEEETRGHDIAPTDTFNDLGYIYDPSNVGGWPPIDAGTPCPDTDKDGMFDAYETATGFDPNTADSNTVLSNGYTRLDMFLAGVQ